MKRLSQKCVRTRSAENKMKFTIPETVHSACHIETAFEI